MPAASFFDPNAGKRPKFEEKYLLDTNVCIYVQWPFPNPHSQFTRNYSRLLKNILDDGGKIILSPPVIMEFSNAFLQIEFKHHKQQGAAPSNFKAYRQTALFESSASRLHSALETLLDFSEYQSLDCAKDEYKTFCSTMLEKNWDYNDSIIVDICQKKGFVLVTHDGDFAAANISLLSTNPVYQS